MAKKWALIIVDYQNDFIEWWKLAIEWWKNLLPIIQKQMQTAHELWDIIIATRDWHPKDTKHFDKRPEHCVWDTTWSNYVEWIDISIIDHHIYKWYGNEDDGYSWFDGVDKIEWSSFNSFENPTDSKTLHDILRTEWIQLIKILWLATDYCVYSTVDDALQKWYEVHIIEDWIASVDEEWW